VISVNANLCQHHPVSEEQLAKVNVLIQKVMRKRGSYLIIVSEREGHQSPFTLCGAIIKSPCVGLGISFELTL